MAYTDTGNLHRHFAQTRVSQVNKITYAEHKFNELLELLKQERPVLSEMWTRQKASYDA